MRHASIRLIVFVLTVIGLASVSSAQSPGPSGARPVPGEMGRPGEVCLLGVCTQGAPKPAGKSHEPTGPAKPPTPADPLNPLAGIDDQLKNLTSGTEAKPVSDWVGMSERDFKLAIANDFVASGNCLEVKHLRSEVMELERFTAEQRAELARTPVKRPVTTTSDAVCISLKKPLGCTVEWPNRADKESQFRAANAQKRQELEPKLRSAEAQVAKMVNYDCKKEGWW